MGYLGAAVVRRVPNLTWRHMSNVHVRPRHAGSARHCHDNLCPLNAWRAMSLERVQFVRAGR